MTIVTMNEFSWAGLLADLVKAVVVTIVGGVVKWFLDRKAAGKHSTKEQPNP